MTLLESPGMRAYSDSGPSAPAPSSRPPSLTAKTEAGGGSLKPLTLREKRQAWGREWGRINSEIGRQLRERGK